MAVALVGEALLSAFLQSLFDRMSSQEIVDYFRGQKLTDGLLRKLKIALMSVNAVLEDAEDKQLTNPIVKEWLDELKDAVYDAEDILDEIATKSLRRKLDAEFQITASQVRNSTFTHFANKIDEKINNVLDRLEFLANQKDLIGLREDVRGRQSERLPTTSLVEESGIFGRDDDKEEVINLLLSDDHASGNENMCVIAIVGMGGIGKTTLAQLLYNDNRVKEHFNLEAWVCVSEEFDVFKITKTLLETVTSSTCDNKDLNRLQVTLKEKLMGKKFLFVLDDVWNKKYTDWEVLSYPFKFGAQGSKIIVTTRDDGVASTMRSIVTHRPKKLLEEDCWSLFAKHAFHNVNSDPHPKLEVIGRKIVKKCEGLPLAVKTIGALLWSKLDVSIWDKILKSELWDLSVNETDILPALRLSYKYLPSYLKRCFAYFSIFPKNYVFEKDHLVLLWMAEGFVQQSKYKTLEEIGDDYFMALVSRSLLQQSSGDKSQFLMHDLVNDLAKFVSGQFTLRLEGNCSHEVMHKTRHLSYFRTPVDSFKKFGALHEAKRLRTFLQLSLSWDPTCYLATKVPQDLLSMLGCLRVLSLSFYENMTELPNSIGKIKHLRYLDLSFTGVRRLPDSLCEMYNLQTLKLSNCYSLTTLPRDMCKLINLRHLDITKTEIKKMPIHLGRLKCLQTLTKFIIRKGSGFCIGELGKLVNLRGKLSIIDIQNVESPMAALDANLKDRSCLEELVMEWNANTNNLESHVTVLDSLRPHGNLKSLTINSYGGKSFPEWVGHHSFSNITSLHLNECKNCCSLPPLGQLPSLHELFVVGFDEVVTVDREFYGRDSSSIKPFGALKVLKLKRMLKWEKWSSFSAENGDRAFPHLGELYIDNCPKLTGGLPIHLPSLVKVEITDCPQLLASLPRAPALCELILRHCNEVLLKELPNGLQKFKIIGLDALKSLPEGVMDSSSCLQELEIYHCSSLESLPMGSRPSVLKTLNISGCMKLELPTHLDYSSLEKLWLCDCDSLKSFPIDSFPKLYHIRLWDCMNLKSVTVSNQHEHDLVTLQLEIEDCPSFVSFPKGGLRAPNLTSFSILKCGGLRSLPDKMHILLSSVKDLRIEDCPKVESFPEGGLPSNLESISIFNCDKLFASRMGWGLQKLPSVRMLSIRCQSEDMESFPEAGLLPTNLPSLHISRSANLKYLNNEGLRHLTSLETLSIRDCPMLKCMPEDGLPASLSLLKISGCPLLKKEWQRKKGKEWQKIAHVSSKLIDDQLLVE
ncbi:putative disease resistance RPP13-like protein 1 [Corylus avellana]|uniref:putative disease resistance RPP13-like protein 1 n=1 Tax=Corylus avellana TaxID=13451 RepID=UPI00286D6415|nr:putative disease resistance RPP13-like protein 1 [Corylus avellana]XP_059455888.1 putative disease resistance RPP13-like protein 1 [Corylus avellana]